LSQTTYPLVELHIVCLESDLVKKMTTGRNEFGVTNRANTIYQ